MVASQKLKRILGVVIEDFFKDKDLGCNLYLREFGQFDESKDPPSNFFPSNKDLKNPEPTIRIFIEFKSTNRKKMSQYEFDSLLNTVKEKKTLPSDATAFIVAFIDKDHCSLPKKPIGWKPKKDKNIPDNGYIDFDILFTNYNYKNRNENLVPEDNYRRYVFSSLEEFFNDYSRLLSVPIPDNIYRNLIYTKYLFNLGIEQSSKSSPLNNFSLLMFHDSIEMFFQSVYDLKKIDRKEYNSQIKSQKLRNQPISDGLFFLQYPEVFEFYELNLKETGNLSKLNTARNNLKHGGHFFATDEIERHKHFTHAFFENNYPHFFKLDFNSLSLVNLIKKQNMKDLLISSEKKYLNNEQDEAISILLAFFQKMHANELLRYLSPKSKSYTELSGMIYTTANEIKTKCNSHNKLIQYINDVRRDLSSSIYFSILSSLGISVKNYVSFLKKIRSKLPISKTDYYFCLDFLVNSYLTIFENGDQS